MHTYKVKPKGVRVEVLGGKRAWKDANSNKLPYMQNVLMFNTGGAKDTFSAVVV